MYIKIFEGKCEPKLGFLERRGGGGGGREGGSGDQTKEASARGVWIFSGTRIQVIELQYMTVRANIKLWHFAVESNNLWNISEKP